MSFKWFQNNSTVTISFSVAATIKKQDVDVYITNSAIRAGIKGSPAACEGQLCSPIRSSKWALKSNMVVIHLEKVTKGKWPSLFVVGIPQSSKHVVRVIYDYDATDPVELTVREGEIITVLNQDPSGWWKGELNGKVGLFPHNFVEVLPTGNVEPPEDMSESASSIQEEEFTSSQDQPLAVQATTLPQFQPPQGQPTASTGSDDGRPRMPAMVGPLSMDELKNKLKKRADDSSNPASTPSTGSKVFTKFAPGAADSSIEAPLASGSKLFGRSSPGTVDSSTEAPSVSGSKLFGRSSPGAADSSAEPPLTGSKVFSRPSELAAARTSRSYVEATEAPTPGPKILLRPTASAEAPVSADPASSTGGSRLKFGNRAGSVLGISAIVAGAIAPNVDKAKPSSTVSTEPAVALQGTPVVPPEPSVGVEQTKSKAGTLVRAVYEYKAVDEGEIGFSEGTEIEVLVRDTSGWWQGKLPTGQVGWFPANFIEEIVLPQAEVPEETIAEKLQKASSATARLATPRRAGGSANRRKPTKQKKAPQATDTSTPKNISHANIADSTQSSRNSGNIVSEIRQISNAAPNAPAVSEDSKPHPKPTPRRISTSQQADETTPDTTNSTPSPPPDNTIISTHASPTSAASSAKSSSLGLRKILPKNAARPMPGPKIESEEKPQVTLSEKSVARPSMPGTKPDIEEKSQTTSTEKLVAPKAVTHPENVVIKEKAMLRWPPNLGNYNEFCNELSTLCANKKRLSIGLCTVDGPVFTCGENSDYTMYTSIFPFVYALAARELGRAEIQKLVAFEQVGENEPSLATVTGLPKALSNSGILVVLGALLSRKSWGNGGRSGVEKLLELLGSVTGRNIRSSLSSFLFLRDTSHQDYAIAHRLKATGHLPDAVDVKDLLDIFFAANSVEIDCQSGAALAAVFVAEGVNTHNNQKIFEPSLVRAVLELLRPVSPGSNMLITPTGTSTVLLFLPKILGITVHTSSEGQAIEIAKSIAKKLKC